MAFFQCGDVRLMLGIPSEPEFDHPSSIIYYRVADIETTHRTLLARGVTFRSEPHVVHRAADHELWMAFFYDADRNTLALTCRKAIQG
jgi:methylmalonyl-CoA/ethylmalonyl-CoA epimerase